MPNSVPVNSLRIEDEHEQEDEDDLVADLGVSSAERYAAPCTSSYLCAKAN